MGHALTPTNRSSLQALKNTALLPKLEHAVLQTMTWSLSVEDQEQLKTKFYALDSDHSGSIETSELQNVMKSLGFDLESHVDLLKTIDTNADGKINFNEF